MLVAERTLEDRLTRIADLISSNRAVNWEIGDEAMNLVKEYGRGIIGKIAEVCGWSRSRVIEAIRLSWVYPPEVRYPDVGRAWYLAALQTAERMGLNPIDVLNESLVQGLSPSQVRRMGREKDRAILKAICSCGIRARIEGPGALAGTAVACPACGVDLGVMIYG